MPRLTCLSLLCLTLAGCENDPFEEIEFDTLYAVFPITAHPDTVAVAKGREVPVRYEPRKLSGPMRRCLIPQGGEEVPEDLELALPLCEDMEDDGWLAYEATDTVVKLLNAVSPDCSGDGSGFNDCWGLSVYGAKAGPGIEAVGHRWIVTERVGRSWIWYGWKRYHGSVTIHFPMRPPFGDSAVVNTY